VFFFLASTSYYSIFISLAAEVSHLISSTRFSGPNVLENLDKILLKYKRLQIRVAKWIL
jgi:hypothetical protein